MGPRMVTFNPGTLIATFVFAAMIATYAKGAGGPFRLLFLFLVGVPVGLTFVEAYAASAPAVTVAAVLGVVAGLKT